jgi:hypothetical protein
MAATRSAVPGKASKPHSGTDEVTDFMRALEHPRKAEMELLRATILAADPGISEGIKWNAPSFRTAEWFATMNFRGKALMVILHAGAKARDTTDLKIDDPKGLLKWLGKDRAAVSFDDMKTLRTHQEAFAAVIRQWAGFVG